MHWLIELINHTDGDLLELVVDWEVFFQEVTRAHEGKNAKKIEKVLKCIEDKYAPSEENRLGNKSFERIRQIVLSACDIDTLNKVQDIARLMESRSIKKHSSTRKRMSMKEYKNSRKSAFKQNPLENIEVVDEKKNA